MRRIDGIELFNECRRSKLKDIDQLGTTVSVGPGRTLCFEGEPGSEFFLLVDGLLAVSKSTRPIARLHPGAWFGETALVHGTVRQASVTTMTESMVVVFNRREFNTLCHLAAGVRGRLERIAAVYLLGAEPTAQWYESSRTRVSVPMSCGTRGRTLKYSSTR